MDIVQGRVKEPRDRIECHKKVTKPLHSPKPVPTGPPLVTPFLGTIGTYFIPLIWALSLQSLKGFSKNGFGPSLEIRSRLFFFLRASSQAQKKETLGPRMILRSRPKIVALIQQEVAREIQRPFPHFFMISGSRMKESFGPTKENNSLIGPCWII